MRRVRLAVKENPIDEGGLTSLGITPEYEGRGFGRRLMDRAVEWLWNQDLEEIWLSTNPGARIRAHGFYQELGWMEDGELPNGDVRYVLRRPKPNRRSRNRFES